VSSFPLVLFYFTRRVFPDSPPCSRQVGIPDASNRDFYISPFSFFTRCFWYLLSWPQNLFFLSHLFPRESTPPGRSPPCLPGTVTFFYLKTPLKAISDAITHPLRRFCGTANESISCHQWDFYQSFYLLSDFYFDAPNIPTLGFFRT